MQNRSSVLKTIWCAGTILAFLGSYVRAGDAEDVATQQAAWRSSLESEAAQRYPEAIASMLTYQENNGDQFLATLRLGWLYYLSGDYENAEKNYETATKSSRGSISPLLGLMKTHQASGDTVKAVRVAKSVLSLDRKNYTATLALAGMYFEAKDYRNAEGSFRDLHTAYPEDPAAMSGFAWSLVYSNDRRAALPIFTKLIAISPDFAFAQDGYKLCGGN